MDAPWGTIRHRAAVARERRQPLAVVGRLSPVETVPAVLADRQPGRQRRRERARVARRHPRDVRRDRPHRIGLQRPRVEPVIVDEQDPRLLDGPPHGGSATEVVEVVDDVDAVALSVAAHQSCAVTRDGALWCWGRWISGYPTRTPACLPYRPVRVPFAGRAVDEALGEQVGCVIDGAGAATYWRPDDGATPFTATPVRVRGPRAQRTRP